MISKHTMARLQMANKAYSYKGGNRLPRKQGPKKRTAVRAKHTEGDWTRENLAVVCGDKTLAFANVQGMESRLDEAAANIELMARAKKLDAFVRKFIDTFPKWHDDAKVVWLLSLAREALGDEPGVVVRLPGRGVADEQREDT